MVTGVERNLAKWVDAGHCTVFCTAKRSGFDYLPRNIRVDSGGCDEYEVFTRQFLTATIIIRFTGPPFRKTGLFRIFLA